MSFDFATHAIACRKEVERIMSGRPLRDSTFEFQFLKEEVDRREAVALARGRNMRESLKLSFTG